MTSASRPPPTGWQLRAYLWLTHLAGPLARLILKRRQARGREDPARWREKLGQASQPRPEGTLVWLHAVGLGEVLALRGLITAMAAERADLRFLVTSGTLVSARVFAANLPPRTLHQFLPLDLPAYVARFLDHWRPDLSVWAEQDIWPGAVAATARRGIPLALVNARMNAAAFVRRRRFGGLYGDLLARFSLISAQDQATAVHLRALCPAALPEVRGSLKAAAPELACDAGELSRLGATLNGRSPWLAASCHAEDEEVALAAHEVRLQADPASLLILAPRDIGRADAIADVLQVRGLAFARRSTGQVPTADQSVWLTDTFGEMGLWYRLVPVALIGGSFGPVEGHNPWEPAALGAAILHGPRVANFAADYDLLDSANAALEVTATGLAGALANPSLPDMAARARALSAAARDSLAPLARDLLALMNKGGQS
ncbi:MAG: glycosyltransferase N-terminal domain-containing protein [Paracoccaceae bacterium]